MAIVLAATGHDPVATFKQLFEAGFTQDGALDQTLISATPIAFTGLAAAAAFRMQLFNIGGEGQLYMGTIGASAAGLYFGGRGGASWLVIVAMIAAGCAAGAAWALIPGFLRAFCRTNEIITSLMLNYVAGVHPHVPDLRQHVVLAGHVRVQRVGLPDLEDAPVVGDLAVLAHRPPGRDRAAARRRPRRARRSRLWVLYSRTRFGFEVQVMGDSTRAARYAGMRTRRKILAVMGISGGDRRDRRREPGRRLQPPARRGPARAAAALLRLHGHRRRRARALQPVRRPRSSRSCIGGLQNAGNTLQGATSRPGSSV